MTVKKWVASAAVAIAVGLGVWGVIVWSGRTATWNNCVATAVELFSLSEDEVVEDWCEERRAMDPGQFAEVFRDPAPLLEELEG